MPGIPRKAHTYRGSRRNCSILGYPDRDWYGVETSPNNNYSVLLKTRSQKGEVHYLSEEAFIKKQIRDKDIQTAKEG